MKPERQTQSATGVDAGCEVAIPSFFSVRVICVIEGSCTGLAGSPAFTRSLPS